VPDFGETRPQERGFFDRLFSFDWLFGGRSGGGSGGDASAGGTGVAPAAPVPHDPGLRPSAATAAPVMSHWAEPVLPGAPAQRPPERRPGDPESVVYLGINDASREKEKGAFKGVPNATLINGAGTDQSMQGKTMSADGETALDLGKEEDLRQFLREAGVGNMRLGEDGAPLEKPEEALARMSALEELFLGKKNDAGTREGGLNPGVRDEMAGFVQHLQKVETGQATMDRVVMSGHSTGNWVYSEAEGNPGVTFAQMGSLMQQFPQAQAGVQDFMLSACHTLESFGSLDTRDGAQYRDIFPNLTNTWGYNGYSPNYNQGSVQHIRNWLQASQGDDPAKVAQAAKRSGQNATAAIYAD
jgi:hypothetical protein